MKKQTKQIIEYTLSQEEANIFKIALEYIKHRQEKHDKCKHLTKESVEKVLNQFYEKH